MFKLSAPTCPTCGEPATGIVQKVEAVARISYFPDGAPTLREPGAFEWSGDSDVDWDCQRGPRSLAEFRQWWGALGKGTGHELATCGAHDWRVRIVGLDNAPEKD